MVVKHLTSNLIKKIPTHNDDAFKLVKRTSYFSFAGTTGGFVTHVTWLAARLADVVVTNHSDAKSDSLCEMTFESLFG